MATFSFIIGLLGTLVSIFALFYAALAARRSEALLRRLVVYPYRELDIRLAELNPAERSALLALYGTTNRGKSDVDSDTVVAARSRAPEISSQMLAFLAERHWLEKTSGSRYRLNGERLPYLHFLCETENT